MTEMNDETVFDTLQNMTPQENPDNDWLTAPLGPFGGVDEIHGDGGKACPEYVPTRYELTILARHWIERREQLELDWFYYGMTSSDLLRLTPYASRRLNRIQAAIGEDACAALGAEEEARLRKQMGERAWKIYCTGTAEEREGFRDEVELEVHSASPMWGLAFDRVKELRVAEFADLSATEFVAALRAVAVAVEKGA